jgi:hypothetical protein
MIVKFIEWLKLADKNDFLKVWGENLGAHLWSKWSAKYDLRQIIYEISYPNLDILESHLKTIKS